MTAAEYAAITGQKLDHEPTRGETNALIVRARRTLAVRRALAVREIQEQAHAFDEDDRKKIITALGRCVMTRDQVKASRRDQGLPDHVTDARFLEQLVREVGRS
jgi:hypothetical protein